MDNGDSEKGIFFFIYPLQQLSCSRMVNAPNKLTEKTNSMLRRGFLKLKGHIIDKLT